MAEFFKLPARYISNIADQANNYSKLGKAAPGRIPESHINTAHLGAIVSAEILRLKSCWKEVALDLTQLGLSLVGLFELAPPVQAAVDITNGSIDIARGHPYIGALSIGAAIPLVGIAPGIGLTVIRLFKVVWSGIKFLALAVSAPGRIVWRFIITNKKTIFTYLPKTDELVEGAVNVGKEIKNAVVSFYERIKKVNIDDIEPQKVDTSYTNNNSIFNGWKKEHEIRSEYDKYKIYNDTYGNIGKMRLWNLWNK